MIRQNVVIKLSYRLPLCMFIIKCIYLFKSTRINLKNSATNYIAINDITNERFEARNNFSIVAYFDPASHLRASALIKNSTEQRCFILFATLRVIHLHTYDKRCKHFLTPELVFLARACRFHTKGSALFFTCLRN